MPDNWLETYPYGPDSVTSIHLISSFATFQFRLQSLQTVEWMEGLNQVWTKTIRAAETQSEALARLFLR